MSIDKLNFPIPPYYSDTTKAKIEVNRNILGVDTYNAALNTNYNTCNGEQKFSNTYIGDTFSLSNICKYRFYDYWHININERLLTFDITSIDKPATIRIELTNSLGPINSYQQYIPGTTDSTYNSNKFYLYEKINLTTNFIEVADTEMMLQTITSSAAASVLQFNNFSLMDIPPTFINPTTQQYSYAVDAKSNMPGKPIFTSPTEPISSFGGLAAVNQYFSYSKYQKSIWNYMTYYAYGAFDPLFRSTGDTIMVCTSSVANVKTNWFSNKSIEKPFVFATQNSYNQTKKQCLVLVYGAVQNAGEVGVIEISSSVGSTDLIISDSIPSWYYGFIDIPCENVLSSSNGGLPYYLNNVTGNLDINLKKTTAISTDKFNVWTVQIMETT